MKTVSVDSSKIQRRWFVVDAEGLSLGRLATRIATVLRGKNKPEFTPHSDNGDFVIITNCDKVRLTGQKLENKMYHTYSGFVGNLRSLSAKQVLADKPEQLIKIAVKGMLPKNKLGRQMFKKLKVYAGPEHPHTAQQPVALDVEARAR